MAVLEMVDQAKNMEEVKSGVCFTCYFEEQFTMKRNQMDASKVTQQFVGKLKPGVENTLSCQCCNSVIKYSPLPNGKWAEERSSWNVQVPEKECLIN